MGLKSKGVSRGHGVDAIMPSDIQLFAGEWTMQGNWYRSFVVIAYPREVKPGWFEPLLRFPRPITLSVYSGPIANDTVMGTMHRSLLWNLGTMEANQKAGRLIDPLQRTAVEDTERMRQGIARGETRLIDTALTLTLSALTKEELDESSSLLMSLASGMLLVIRRLYFQPEVGLKRLLPIFDEPIHPREMDTGAWATLFPYATQELIHAKGQVFGTNGSSHSLVIVDRFSLPSPHSITVAWSGAGKSFQAKLEILRSRYRGIPVKVLDPEGEYRVLKAAGAQVWAVGDPGGPGFPWDPFAIDADDSAEDVERQTDFLVQFIRRLDPDVPELIAVVEQALWRLVKVAGSTPVVFHHEPRRLCDDTTLIEAVASVNPRMGERLESIVQRWRLLAPEPNLEPRDFEVYDISRLTQRMKAAAYLALTEHIARTVDKAKRQLVVFDEAWQLLTDEATARYLESLFRRARKWGTALSLITQDIGDFTRSRSAEVCLRNAPLILLLRQHPESLEEVTRMLRLHQGEVDLLTTAERGEGLLIVGDDHVPLHVGASRYEEQLISGKIPQNF